MKNLKLFADRLGHPSRFCIQFLQMNKISFEEHKVTLLKGICISLNYISILSISWKKKFYSGENKNHPHLPMKQIPVLQAELKNNNQPIVISQSTTILRYLSDKLEEVDDKWYPKNLENRAKIDEFIDFFHFSMNSVSISINMYIIPTYYHYCQKNYFQKITHW